MATENGGSRAGAPVILALVLAAILLGAGLYVRLNVPLNQDIAYLVTIDKSILAGSYHFGADSPVYASLLHVYQLAYFWLPAWVAQASGLSGTVCVNLFIGLHVAFAAWALGSYLREAETLERRFAVFLVPVFVLMAVLWPVESFGQREHIFFLLSLPYALHVAAKAGNRPWRFGDSPAVAIAFALAILIKPQFTLLWVMLEGYAAWRARRFRALFNRSSLTVFGMLVVYYAAQGALLAANLDKIAYANSLYHFWAEHVIQVSWNEILVRKLSLLWLGAAAAFLLRGRLIGGDTTGSVLFVAFAACFIQVVAVKMWIDYHWLPCAAYAVLATARAGLAAAAQPSAERWRRGALVALAAASLAFAIYRPVLSWAPQEFARKATTDGLAQAMGASSGKPRSGTFLGTGNYPFFAAAAQIGLSLGSRFGDLWYVETIRRRFELEPSAETGLRLGEAMDAVMEDLDRRRPDFVVISPEDMPVMPVILADPRFIAALRCYREGAEVAGYRVFSRAATCGPAGASQAGASGSSNAR